VNEQNFNWWKQWVKDQVDGYEDEISRMVLIAGFFNGIPQRATFTAAQVSEILALRRTEKEKRAHKIPARREAH